MNNLIKINIKSFNFANNSVLNNILYLYNNRINLKENLLIHICKESQIPTWRRGLGGLKVLFQPKVYKSRINYISLFLEKIYNTIDIDAIVCVNSAVYLTSSNAVEIFKKFDAKGVAVSSCGTCLDFYNIREKLQVGNVGSMDLLVNLMNQAEKVIRP